MDVFNIDRRIVHFGIAGAVVAGLWVADSNLAMHAEHNVAQTAKHHSQLENTPDVYVGGLPVSAAMFTKEVPFLEVKSQDIEVPELGVVNAATTLRDITVTPNQVISGDFAGAPVSTYTRGINIDSIVLGRLLGISDLSISNPDDISPAGGPSAEAELTGTLPGDADESTVKVTLRLDGHMFHMKPFDTDDERLIEAFSFSFDTRKLPLPAQATYVRLQGGTIAFETQQRNIRLENAQLSPLEIQGSEAAAIEEAENKAADTERRVGR
ncbi:DUF2993 domain-containing protein [Corynebacterium camporealensis]|uniref:DUF2993 domain-containing protein n=1 Tax=Corynebacterium camporealensis TaxID=161896 RepID=UPI0034CF50C4